MLPKSPQQNGGSTPPRGLETGGDNGCCLRQSLRWIEKNNDIVLGVKGLGDTLVIGTIQIGNRKRNRPSHLAPDRQNTPEKMVWSNQGVCRSSELAQIGWRGLDATNYSSRAIAWNILDRFQNIDNTCAVVRASNSRAEAYTDAPNFGASFIGVLISRGRSAARRA
jgi:hypothetical protein